MSEPNRFSNDPESFELRLLEHEDVGEVVRLHEEAVAESKALGKGVLIGWHEREYFHENIEDRGFILGCFHAGRQIGYCSARFPFDKEINFGSYIGLAGQDLMHVAHLNGAYVEPSFRGRGLHNFMAHRRRSIALRRGARHFLVEIHVNNGYSLRTQFDLNLKIKTMTRDGENHYFLLHTEAATQPSPTCSPGEVSVHAHDIAAHLQLTSDGYWGIRCSSRAGQTWIEYARRSTIESSDLRSDVA